VWLVFNRGPVATPFEAKISTESTDDFVERRFENGSLCLLRVGASFENCDINGDAEIVVEKPPRALVTFLPGLVRP
jgi:hypothetical protein